MPFVQKALKEALHRETLDAHLNGDETVAFGMLLIGRLWSRCCLPSGQYESCF